MNSKENPDKGKYTSAVGCNRCGRILAITKTLHLCYLISEEKKDGFWVD